MPFVVIQGNKYTYQNRQAHSNFIKSDLVNTIQTIHRFKPAPFPEANERVFAEIVNRHMGYQ